jgi:hypothetical protein
MKQADAEAHESLRTKQHKVGTLVYYSGRKFARGAPRWVFQKAVGIGTLLLGPLGSLVDYGLDKALDKGKEMMNEKHRMDRVNADVARGYITPESQRKAVKHSVKDMKDVLQTMDENMVKFKDAFDAVYRGWPQVANIGSELFEVSPEGNTAMKALYTFIAQIVYAEHYCDKLQYHLAGVKQFAKDFEEFCTRSAEALKASREAVAEGIDGILDERDKADFDALWKAAANGPLPGANSPLGNAPKMAVPTVNLGFQGGVLKK